MKWVDTGILILIFAAIGALGYSGYLYYDLSTQFEAKTTAIGLLEHNIQELSQKLSASETLSGDLLVLLRARQEESQIYNSELQKLASTVSMLDKLSKTDKELLQKYSAVYFLNENYVPLQLSPIESSQLLRTDKPEQIHSSIKPFLDRLMAEAASAQMDLKVQSAFRSFGTQATLKSSYKLQYGAGTANAFSAEQGFSEHQLGSTVDFTTTKLAGSFATFDKTKEFTWLKENAHRFGFILSYPKNNPFFVYEPWHWRYVGVELATKLHVEQKSFYDLDQREINLYLAKIFD